MAPRLSSPSFLGRRISKSDLTRTALLALLGVGQTACPPVEVDDTADFIQVPANLARDGSAPSEVGTPDVVTPVDSTPGSDVVDASTPPVDTGNDVVMGTDTVDVIDAGTDGGVGPDVVDAAMPPVDTGTPCRPVSMTVSGDNINNSYDTQTAVPVVINTTGDCSMIGSSIPMNINYGPSVAMLRPVLAIDSMRNQIRTNLDLTDPMLVGFPDNHRNVRAETTIGGSTVSASFLRKRYPATIVSSGTVFGTFGGSTEYNARIQLNDTSTPGRPDDFNREALIGIDFTNDTGTTLLWHGALNSCAFGSTVNPCVEDVLDGSGRTQRCFIPNMLTADRSSGFCDVSEGRVFTYPGGGVSFGMQIRGVDFTRIRTATSVGGYIRAAVYITDVAQNVTVANYRFRRSD